MIYFLLQISAIIFINFDTCNGFSIHLTVVINTTHILFSGVDSVEKYGKEFTAQKMKFSIKDFYSKCDLMSHLLKKSLMENFIFCALF